MIDWDRLTALRADIGDDDFADVATLFVAEIQETLDRLAVAPGQAVPADFHFLRGSAANLGFRALAQACSDAELAMTGGQPPDIAAIAALFQASVAEVTPQLPHLTAMA